MTKFATLFPVAFLAVSLLSSATVKAADDKVMAEVNGTKIMESTVEANWERLPEQYKRAPKDQIMQALLQSLVDSKVAADYARESGFVEKAEIKAQLQTVIDEFYYSALLSRLVEEKVTDKAVQDRYDAFVKVEGTPTEINARHILVKTEDEAKALIKELDAGKDFAELAGEKSIGPTKTRGGDLGYFRQDGSMVESFETAAFALEKGAYTKTPVQTQFGWHVIKVEDKRDAKPTEAKLADIKTELAREVVAAYMDELRAKAKVVHYDMDGKPIKEK